ncbi:uncharacterized protein EDB91DRAFT_21025 [Suillus paluster]|uniref:uncharacterized protein n=1 Tax=Suillus paluster TaxID=48578 RepID=UPI001B875962|nr:uncharacterized protein EDB91DRAFT_21025 [Suillus paluster]KAG1756521.1 hypothetical protein EDB91DRAFT_21025 [Suillus paluster]
MESFPVFFKVRAITFTCIILISFIWVVLLSVEAYTRWDISDRCSRSLTAVFILTNTTTILILPFLLLLKFRVWLDAARILLLMVAQIGSAAAFTYWNPQIQCPDQTADQLAVCKLINIYSLMGCWIVPAIFVLYASYFAATVYRQSRIPVVVESREKAFMETGSVSPVVVDPEMAITSPRLPALNTRASIFPPCSLSSDSSPFSRPEALSASPLTITALPPLVSRIPHPVVLQPRALDKLVQMDGTNRKSGRLSKPLPHWCI